MLADPGRFPTPALSDIPLAEEADRYYRKGPTFLRSVFPYSVANFLERAWVLAGFSGHGFKFGPLLGLAVAAAATDPALMRALPAWAAGEAPPAPGLLAAAEGVPA